MNLFSVRVRLCACAFVCVFACVCVCFCGAVHVLQCGVCVSMTLLRAAILASRERVADDDDDDDDDTDDDDDDDDDDDHDGDDYHSWILDVLEGDALAITLGFFVPSVLLRSSWA